MNTNAKHTQLPWSNDPMQPTIWANDGDTKVATIADLPWKNGKSNWMEEQANAEFIVRACNSHYELVESAREALGMIEYHCADNPRFQFVLQHLKKALASAQGKEN